MAETTTDSNLYDEGESVPLSPTSELQKEQQIEEWRSELTKTEEEINTLKGVLQSKTKRATELKKLLGISPMQELKADLSSGLQSLKESDAFRKTKEGFNKAGEKTTSAFSSVGKKLANVRNSDTFKSFEDTLTSVKNRVTGSKSEQSFDEALKEAEAEKATKTNDEVSPPTTQ